MDPPINIRTEPHQHPNLRKLARALIAISRDQRQAKSKRQRTPRSRAAKRSGDAA